MTRPSTHVTEGMQNALNRIYFHAMGLRRAEIERALVGVATAWHGGSAAGQLPLRVAQAVEEGVWAGGATPRQFATIAEPDPPSPDLGLLTRELVADSVELTIRGHSYDALVGIGATELSLAGLLLAACRLDIPAVVVPLVGPSLGSPPEATGLAAAVRALGLAPDGSEPVASIADALEAGQAAGTTVARRIADGATARTLVTPDALRSAARELTEPALAVHLAALAVECGLDLTLADLTPPGARWIGGDLAPDGALLHGAAAERRGGRAQVFDDGRSAGAWLATHGWPDGVVLVVRGQGPRGGPGMPWLRELAAHAAPAGALLVTDGRAPSLPGVACVSAVGPEAAAGGPLAALRDGDEIALADSTLSGPAAAARATCAAAQPDAALSPAASKYVRTVGPARSGASTHPGAAHEGVRYADR